jgi:transcriptional antiterminator RfaH
VQFGERLGLLADELISELKAHLGKDELVDLEQKLEPGQNVEIIQGPFQGLEALVTRYMAAKDRVQILIEWMGRTLHAEASVADLVPLTGQRMHSSF